MNTLFAADTPFDKRFPSNDELPSLPFGQYLIDAKKKDEPRDFHKHMCYVIEGVGILISEFPGEILFASETIADKNKEPFISCLLNFKKKVENDPAYERLLKLCAFYHDIGVAIRRDRHSIEGVHILRDLDPDEREKLELIIYDDDNDRKKHPELLNMLLNIIGHHELFGVLSTGESSAPIFVELVKDSSGQEDIEEFNILLSILALLNLADLNARIKERNEDDSKNPTNGMSYIIADTIIKDWQRISDAFGDANGDKREFAKKLIDQEERPNRTIERLCRIITETTPPEHLEYCKINKEDINLGMAVGNVTVNEFCELLAHISKLDYFLRFYTNYRKEAIKRGNIETDRVCITLVKLLARIISGYRDLIKSSLIGVEFEHVQDDVSKHIIDLLLGDIPEEGEEWMIDDEATIWVIYRL